MSSKYDLLITIDPSTGITPGYQDRSYYPGQTIKGSVDLTVYEPITIDQIRIALLGFQETTFIEGAGRDPTTWKEKHIFLKQLAMILPESGNRTPHAFHPNDSHRSSFEFQIPEYSVCETCQRSERLPPSMSEARAEDRNRVYGTASITYQVEVSVELRQRGDIYFHEKFDLQPLLLPESIGIYNDIKRNYSYGEFMIKSKESGNTSDPVQKKKSLFKLIFSRDSTSGNKFHDIPLRLGIRPEESFIKIIPGHGLSLPPTSFLLEYRGDSLAYPLPFVSLANSVSTRLGHFTIKTLQINSRHPHIKTFCAGRESSVRSKRKIYVNNQLNVPFDIGSDFTYNKSTSTFQKELRLIEDIVCHIIDIELESYDADFPLHCGQIARKNGLLEFIIGLLPNGGTKLEYVEITVPFKFLGVADGFVPPPVVAPAEVPSDFKAPVGPPQPASSNSYPKDMKSPDGPRGYEPPQGPPVQESYTPPQGPPPGNNTFDIAPPPGPPPGSHAGDIAPPQGPPPGSYPNRAPTENLIDLETPEEVPPSYTSVAK